MGKTTANAVTISQSPVSADVSADDLSSEIATLIKDLNESAKDVKDFEHGNIFTKLSKLAEIVNDLGIVINDVTAIVSELQVKVKGV